MPINETTAKTSIEFKYEHRNAEGELTLTYNLQFSHTKEYGPTLTIYNDDGTVGAEVPVEMFLDTVQYLVSRGVVQISQDKELSTRASNVSKSSSGMIPLLAVLDDVATVDPLQSFTNSNEPSGLSMPTITTLEPSSTEIVGEALDLEQMAAERAMAAKKAKVDASKFKPSHKPMKSGKV